MDESIFRLQLQGLQPSLCPFQQAILNACVDCARSNRVQIAEREVALCNHPGSRLRCIEMHKLLHQNFNFALGIATKNRPHPHAHAMRIQCGGLRGLSVLFSNEPEVGDVDALFQQIQERTPDFTRIDFSTVVRLAREHYQGRRHSPNHKT